MVEDTRTYTRAELEEVAGQCAGAAAGVFLRKFPDEIMPTEEISRGIGLVLADFDERRSRGETRHISVVAGAGDAETVAKRTALADRLAERLEGDDG